MKKAIILGVLILSVTIPALSLAAQTSVSSSASISGSIANVTVQSNTALPNSILDLELYDANGNKAAQAYVETDVPNGSLACSWNMSAPAGAYTLRIGVFNGNWTTLYNWNNGAVSASGPFVGDNHVTCGGAQVQPVFTSSAAVQGSAAGGNGIFTTTVQADHAVPSVLIDTEVFDASNNKINQWYETDALAAGVPFNLSHAAVLPSAGNYTVKVGLFSPDWATLYAWNNAAYAFTTVATSSGNPLPPPPPSNNTGVITPATQTVQPGASVDFTGHNFGHEETVLLARNGTNVSSVHADGGGNFSTGSMSMPNANGTYTFTFTGQTSGIVGTSTIQIGPVSQPQSDFSFSIANSNAVPPSKVVVNTNNQPLGSFTTTIQGEAIVLHGMNLYIATSSTGTGLLQNVSITNSTGQIIGGPYNAVYDSATGKQRVTFISPLAFDLGTNTYKVIGMLPTSFASGGSVTVSTNPATDWGTATSYPSHILEALPNTTVSLNSATIQNDSLNISLASTPVPQSITPGGSIVFTNIQLDASASPEDIRISSLPVSFAGTAADISGCQLENGSTMLNTGSRVVNTLSTSGANTFSFDNLLTIPKGTVTTLQLLCNVSSTASYGSTYHFGINSNYSYSAFGAFSQNTFTPVVTSNAGPVMTVSGSSLTVATDSSAPAYALVAGGTTGVPVNVLKLRAINEPITLQKIGLKLTSGSAQDLTVVNLYAGTNIQTTSGVSIPANTMIGSATFLGNSTIATSTLSTQIQLPKDVDATIVIKADIADVGTNQPGTEGDLVAVDYRSAQGTGANSGNTIFSPSLNNNGVAGVRIVHTLPVVSVGPGMLTISGGSNQVLEKFNITAATFGSLGLSKLNFAIATTSVAVTNLQLHAYIDSGYSQPANVPGSPGGQFGTTVDATTNAGLVNFLQTGNPFEIGAGSTIYFALTGNVTPAVSATTWSVSSTLLGDTAFDGMKQANTISGNFVWSPNATSTAAFAQNDWTNGFGVAGLPSSGVTQTRSN